MVQMTYRIDEHDGGWAYEPGGTYSKPSPITTALAAPPWPYRASRRVRTRTP